MNLYISFLNDIKSNIGSLPLTPSQTSCKARIEERLVYPGAVNLFGLHGVGKTVLGWAMSKERQTVYVVHPSVVEKTELGESSVVFVDNARADRSAFRRLLGVLESKGITKSVIVTHHPADDYVFRSELCFSEEDIETARDNLMNLGYPIVKGDWNNLWQGIIQLARDCR